MSKIIDQNSKEYMSMADYLENFDFPLCENEAVEETKISRVTIAEITEKAKQLRTRLSECVLGQAHAINTFIKGYFQAELASVNSEKISARPKATFLFAGPPGVGKTFFAEKIAEELKLPYRRFDMSEYADKEANVEFCGSDKAYKNAKPGNVTDFVAKHPKAVLLFDEVEKAHIVAIHLFLQILDAGRVRDNFTDDEVSFLDCILIFTTNAGKQLYEDSVQTDLSGTPRKVILNALRKDVDKNGSPYFPPAICSRFASGNIVLFNHLDTETLLRIAKREIGKQITVFENQFQITIEPDEKVYSALMFSEGGNADGRTVSNRARTFLSDELFELFRLITEENSENGIKNLEKVIIQTDLAEQSKEITSLFYPSGKSEILVYASKQGIESIKSISPDINLVEAQTIAEARRKIKTHDISFIIIDMEYGVSDNSKYLNFEDVKSKARDFWLTAQVQFPEIPVFLFNSADRHLSIEERLSYMRHGVQDILYVDPDFSNTIAKIAKKIHKQNSMSLLAKSNKLLDFETAQTLSEDKTQANILLFDFKLAVAVDAEDSENILSAVSRPDIGFEQIIGAEDAKNELKHFITYLKNPRKYIGTGLQAPKGVIFYGPPGTGKTMLAKAMAKESGVAFIAAEGNQFLKKYVGEGAQKVHELFKTARKYAPSILFIDEIDAIAKERTGGENASASEATLTAFLAEMDGFVSNPSKPVFVLAATNFDVEPGTPKSLDAALMRRFDRRIYIDLPDKEERIRYLRKRFEENKSFAVTEQETENLAMRSTGMSLAELASVMDFSLRTAILEDKLKVNDEIIEKAFETFQFGDAKPQTIEQIERTARHESGHALLCWLSGETPSYLTIVSRGKHGGYMQHANEEEKTFYSKNELLSKIRTSLGGRAAEIVYYGEEEGTTTSSLADFASASILAEKMICTYSMDSAFGLRVINQNAESQNAIALSIHQKVNQILEDQMEMAIQTIKDNMPAIDALVQALLLKNRLTGSEINSVIEKALKK